MRKILLPLLAIIFLIACDKNRIFEKNTKIPDMSWDKSNVLKFEVPIEDTITPSNIYINIRNASQYQFSNLFLYFTTRLPDGSASRDTVEVTLADEKGWLGDGSGDIWDNRFLFKKNFRFPHPGTYTFELEQGMRPNPLPLIMDAGIRIEKAQ